MTNIDSLKDFFFNIVPGIFFIFLFNFFYPLTIQLPPDQYIIFILTFGFILGFIFDSLYTYLRSKLKLDDSILCSLFNENKNFEMFFNKSKQTIIKGLNLNKEEKLKLINIKNTELIYLMDHLVSSKGFSIHVNYACTRASFWGNLSVAILTLFCYDIFQLIINKNFNQNLFLFSLIALIISYLLLNKMRRRFFSTVINAFTMSELYSKE